jgi:uncharacterized protein YndB with AHSA1/START domain
MEVVEREVVVPAAPGVVWPALTRSDELSAWFGADVRIDARPGGRGVVRWPDGTERPVLVEEVEPARKLAFRWLPFQRRAGGEVMTLPSTRVEITLDEVPGGTRVRVVERPAFSLGAPGARGAGGALATRTSRGAGRTLAMIGP